MRESRRSWVFAEKRGGVEPAKRRNGWQPAYAEQKDEEETDGYVTWRGVAHAP